jgi:membrane protein implicated in regulation of membrane protease activity
LALAALALTLALTLTAGVLLLTLTAHPALLALTARALLPFAAHAALTILFSFSSFTTGILFTIRIHKSLLRNHDRPSEETIDSGTEKLSCAVAFCFRYE